jgi:hypothetical protein
MGAIEAVLTTIGLLSLVGLVVGWQFWRSPSEPAPPVGADLTAPYREGLDAAMRLHDVAQELQQELYVEAIRHLAAPNQPTTIRYEPRMSSCTKSKN